ncbi:glycoside hydrolase family 15 protein [Sulfurisphaera ohwakuensis]|uniref:GH15 family glucan-1,4-alpha-glucosidase n=1 Tax=Sulfurisphaera ohwakuensis TaxID=69656 RepID=A0A650CIQ2_SULOH|nr:glycoside hydrolase family 15 protein [Sulfurisphaera ohwakuensis]MBB5253333.1 GH15 family glucan-1,4-alpha-glucosidase [Sulfurisphaera ohwakuensis]QGR17656.1 glycoside hydrolase family 15 protein [Sulfurisphaera ohwakuensis]
MVRYVILGNGSLTLLADSKLNYRELYYPLPIDNHLHESKIGLWVDGKFSWFSDLPIKLNYEEDTLSVTASAEFNGVKVKVKDAVDMAYNILVREISLTTNKETRVFFHWDFHINGNDIGDTALYDPFTSSIIHYKRDKWFMFKCDIPFYQYATGYKETAGYLGTWKDAEDGELSGNPIAQGAVDSVTSIRVSSNTVFYCWLVCGRNYNEVFQKNNYALRKTPRELLRRTENYWKAWLVKARDYDSLVRRSLLIIAAHWQNNGALPAALDTDIMRFNKDTYNYVWHRDAAFAAIALTLYGYQDPIRNLFNFTKPLIFNGFLFQKYTCDGNWGSTWHPWNPRSIPIQEDETALMLYALWVHFSRFTDIDFVKPLYAPFVKKIAEFLVSYRDEETGLPLPSYDLWEERLGTHFFTSLAVYAGLMSAYKFAEFFGDENLKDKYLTAANEVKKGLERFYVGDHFARTIYEDNSIDKTVDASTLFASILGPFDPKDPRVISNRKAVEEKLNINGGIARYENDWYLKQDEKSNAWFITTLWLAQQYILEGNKEKAKKYIDWVISHMLPTGIIPEQVSPKNTYPSVAPLVWSHAEFVKTIYYFKQLG